MIIASRYHDFCAGHRVLGHEGKCANLHGHNYRVHFHCSAEKIDEIGRVIDFSVIKSTLCQWLEDEWDHKMLIWEKDPLLEDLLKVDNTVVSLPFNPTAENLGEYMLKIVAPSILPTGFTLSSVDIEETRKCSVSCSL